MTRKRQVQLTGARASSVLFLRSRVGGWPPETGLGVGDVTSYAPLEMADDPPHRKPA